MKMTGSALLLFASNIAVANAQQVPVQPAPDQQVGVQQVGGQQVGAFRTITLPPNAEVLVTPNDDLSSKSARVGDKFRIATVLDVVQDGFVVVPRGTVGEATVIYRTGKGAFGKSAKMEVEFNWLQLGDRQIPISGKFRQEGEGNTGAAVGAVVAVGVLGAFVTGHSATITNGQQLHAHTVEALAFEVPAATMPIPTAKVAKAAAVAAPAGVQVASAPPR
jgi:hypothetical protein